MAIKGILSDSLCWKCSRATDGSCSWSDDFVPVKGWKAEQDIIGRHITYNVRECPMFTMTIADRIKDEKEKHKKDASLDTKRKLYAGRYTKLYGYEMPCKVHESHNITDTGARSLSNAVIAGAGQEYLKAMKHEKRLMMADASLTTKRILYGTRWCDLYGYRPLTSEIVFCEAFFKSEQTEVFSWDVNPVYIMESIRREVGIRIGQ